MEQWWWSPSLAHPLRSIALCFVAWKSLLLVIAACSPGRGYDTSTSLILPSPNDEGTLGILDGVLGRLTRWDAIYFVKIASRYYVFEQEWAFGWGLILWLGTSGLKRLGVNQYAGMEALVGVMVAHAAHFFAVLCLYSLTQAVFPGVHSNRFALSTALLHILSPAGLFLSAPYAESSCALMTFFGHLLFAKSLAPDGYPTAFQDFLTLCCGMSFGIATTLRSNGLLNGLVLLEEAFRTLLRLKQGFHMNVIRRLLLTGFGGICVGAGFVIPQYIAYMEYCGHTNGEATRPWCGKPIPSIYAFVQDHYWNVGLFRYWTLSNLPLFFLAAPISTIMIISGQLNTSQPNDTDERLNNQQMEELDENNEHDAHSQFGPEDYGVLKPDLPRNHQFQLPQFGNAQYQHNQHNQQQFGPFPYGFQHNQYQHEQLGAFNNLSSTQHQYRANDSHGHQHPSTPLSAQQPSTTPTTPQSAQGNTDKGDKKEEKNALLLKMIEQLKNKNNNKDNVNSTASANGVSETATRKATAREAASRESSQHKAQKSPAQRSPIKASANDIDDLISDGKISNMGLVLNTNHNSGTNTPPKASSTILLTSRGGPQVRNSTSSAKNVKNGGSTKIASRPTSTGSISEGEILEDSTPNKILTPTEPRYPTRSNRILDTSSRKDSGTEDQIITNLTVARHRPRDAPVSPRAPSQHPKEHSTRHGRDEQELKKVHDERAVHPTSSDHRSSVRRTDPYEDHRRADTKHDQKREEKKPAQNPSSTLDQLIQEDPDLRDWLQMTGWDNVTYREEKLNHRREVRRQIAELDAKKAELLALEAASGPSGVSLVSSSTMLPPDLPTQSSSQALVEKSGNTSAKPVRVILKKRSMLEDDVLDRAPAKRVKEDYDTDRPPGSSSSDAYRRSGGNRDHHERRHRERSYSHERDSGSSAYHNRPSTRPTLRDPSDYYEQDRERDDRSRDPRPFEVRGGYRGRAFDPNYRNRGGRGGRGRGEWVHAQQDQRNDPAFGLRIANGKPFKDPKGFDKGGRGDTRYFIVKSFNEDNVLNCIEDSIWTTQVQNGQTFKEAFQTCRNVILVFSINKSKAFQGYARMESLPGSVSAPSWQNAINWESAGAFRVKWLTICSTQFNTVGHLKNKYNENLAVLIGKDGQEIEENCGAALIDLIDQEAEMAIAESSRFSWDDYTR
ncbi:hypothetical protein B7494_g3652 [Chlorociboria aeruginascens]|nr:hypothetical protein B7494_g3652 [Chlorociboria aeruginascens]